MLFRSAAKLDRPAAGKTGTSQDYRNAWFIGFTADLVTGVWFGNDDNSSMKKVTGGMLPAHTWHEFMVTAETNLPVRDLPALARIPQAVVAEAGPEAMQPGAPIPGEPPGFQPTAPAPAEEDGGLIGRLLRGLTGG